MIFMYATLTCQITYNSKNKLSKDFLFKSCTNLTLSDVYIIRGNKTLANSYIKRGNMIYSVCYLTLVNIQK